MLAYRFEGDAFCKKERFAAYEAGARRPLPGSRAAGLVGESQRADEDAPQRRDRASDRRSGPTDARRRRRDPRLLQDAPALSRNSAEFPPCPIPRDAHRRTRRLRRGVVGRLRRAAARVAGILAARLGAGGRARGTLVVRGRRAVRDRARDAAIASRSSRVCARATTPRWCRASRVARRSVRRAARDRAARGSRTKPRRRSRSSAAPSAGSATSSPRRSSACPCAATAISCSPTWRGCWSIACSATNTRAGASSRRRSARAIAAERNVDRFVAQLAHGTPRDADARGDRNDPTPGPEPLRLHDAATGLELGAFFDADSYAKAVAEIREEIAAGEVYQANLTHRLAATFSGDAWRLHEALRARSPAPYAAFLTLPEITVVGASPERFLHLDADGSRRDAADQGHARARRDARRRRAPRRRAARTPRRNAPRTR